MRAVLDRVLQQWVVGVLQPTARGPLGGYVEEGMQVLVHAAASGVGAFAVRHCKSRRPTVHATASARNAEFVGSLGTDTVIDYETADFRDAVSDLDVVYDAVGGDVHLRSQSALKPGGPLVCAAPFPTAPGGKTFAFRRRRSRTNARP